MKICTYNINSIRARKDLVLDWLEHRNNDIDILCLQELKTTEENFPFEDFKKTGFQSLAFGQKTYNGVAICTKIPSEKTQKGFKDKEWDEQKRIITSRIRGINIINIYAPRGDIRGTEKFLYKQNWYRKLIAFLNENYSAKEPILIMGDFNVTRKEIDVYSPEALKDSIGTMPEERVVFRELMNWNLLDAFRHLYPEKQQFTWWDYIGGAIWKNEGMRVDYILCTPVLIDKIKEIEVDLWPRKRQKPTPSDHAPLVASLEF